MDLLNFQAVFSVSLLNIYSFAHEKFPFFILVTLDLSLTQYILIRDMYHLMDFV